MTKTDFPTEYFVGTVVRLLDTIQHKDTNYTPEQRVRALRHVYSVQAEHFSQPHVYHSLKIKDPKKLEAGMRTITGMTVYCWVNASLKLKGALAIYLTYMLILDDCEDDPHPKMEGFFHDMVNGKPPQHPWLRLVNEHFPNVLDHYGPFCALNIYRSTVDFFEGCWIEQYNFHGYYGSEDYPEFLRRLNGLGHFVGASLWPAELFDEREIFTEITTAICMMENWMTWVNDLVSFYKEFDEPHDQTSLIKNYCHVGGLTLTQGLEKLTRNTLRVTEQIVAVFDGKDARIADSLTRFMHGFITWHLCDDRYRMGEIYEQVDTDGTGGKFRRYYEEASKVGRVDAKEWAHNRSLFSRICMECS